MTLVPMDSATAWQQLATVLDPEVPVLSIVELGIVREVTADATGVYVTITPTYAGCPAMTAIVDDIRAALDGGGDIVVQTVLAPAWSTDWIAPEGRARLRAYGITPPAGAEVRPAAVNVAGISPLRRQRAPVECPRCGAQTTSLVSQFGSTACKALYRCDACSEPFDYLKPH